MHTTRRLMWPAMALIGGLAAALAMAGQAGAQGSEELPDELRSAIVQYMDSELEGESTGMDCETAQQENATPGNWCWEVQALSENEATVRFGPLQSEFMESATFVRQPDNAWTVSSAAPEPPPTGTGLANDGNSAGSTTWAAGTAVLVVVGLALAQARHITRSR